MNPVSRELKASIVQRMMLSNNESVSRIARESGLSETTLYKWKNAAKAKGFTPTNETLIKQNPRADLIFVRLLSRASSSIHLSFS